jgi:phosphohistidine swiveling domain-containing protein
VTSPAFIPLTEVDQLASHQLDTLGSSLLTTAQLGLPIAPTFLIPTSVLTAVLHKNESIQTELIQFYHHYCSNDFVTFYYQAEAGQQAVSIPYVKGDANFIQTLFEVASLQSHLPIIIQSSPQPSYSGLAWTTNQETHNKNQVEIWSTPGEFSEPTQTEYDRFIVDHRTSQVVEQHLNPNPTYWQKLLDGLVAQPKKARQHPLARTTLTQLAAVAIQCKRHFFADYKIYWSVVGTQLLINHLEPVKADATLATTHQVVTIGTPLLGGYVQGTVFFPSPNKQPTTGSILVIEQLSQANWPAIKQASGVIIEKNIADHQTLKTLSQYGIPTLVKAHFATKNLQSGQSIILDAHHGKVYLDETKPGAKPVPANHSAWYCLTSYPSQLNNYQADAVSGLLVTSNHWYTSLKKHPLQLTQSEKNTFLSTMYEELKAADQRFNTHWMYFLCSLDSKARSLLSYGSAWEEPEINPSLGLRGISYLLKHPLILDLELTSLAVTLEKLGYSKLDTNRLALVLPFTASIEDGVLFHTILREKYPQLSVNTWLHLNSLEGLTSTLNHHTWHPAGIVLDLDYLLHSWHGTDPQPTSGHPATNYAHSSLWPYLNRILENNHLPLKIICRRLSHNLLSQIWQLKPQSVITTHTYLTAARTR